MDGKAPETLLDSYDIERIHGADENIMNSTRSTDFITPKSETSRLFRDAVLDLSEHHAFARPLVNSGRLSVPCTYDGSPLNGPDVAAMPRRTRPGSPAADAPTGSGWLLDRLGNRFQLLAIDCDATENIAADGIEAQVISLACAADPSGALRERYLGSAASAVYLMRPDQHVAARWTEFGAAAVKRAIMTATGRG
jgi:3-(3-hydroxy-phenyl)propionate hydroxylase